MFLEHQVVPMDRLGAPVHGGGNIDDTGGRGGDQQVFELIGQGEMCEMIDRERRLVPVLAESAVGVPDARVIHEDAERIESGLDVLGKPAHVRQRGKVCLKGLDARAL